ncbi:MAG TPA: hypothetical protein VF458_10780, partial [Ktedonobacteraceae bacterium]
FHHPDELRAEISESGLQHSATFAVEGPLWLMRDALASCSEPWQETILTFLRIIEQEPTLLGASAHLLAVARK